MPDSFAGITVPEGEPEAVRDAAAVFRGVAGSLHGVSGDLRSVPGLVSDWQGPASAAFAGTTVTNGSTVDRGAEAMDACAQAATTYADELEAAQDEAEAAIAQARDAQSRIDAAQADIESALSAQTSAGYAIQSAEMRLSSGVPDPSADADRSAGYAALGEAQAAESDARRRLEQAQDDLERAQARGERAEQDARDAARAAAGAFEGAAGGSVAAAMFGGSPTAIENRVLARVRAGDYSVLDDVPLNYLPADTQQEIGAELAEDAEKAAYGEGDHSIEELAGITARYQHDDELATGFYNHLGGRGTADFASNLMFFGADDDGYGDPELLALTAPFATLLGTATRTGNLRSGFTSGFLRKDLSLRDRLGGHYQLTQFVMAGEASNYSGEFLSEVGEEILITPRDPTLEDGPAHVELSEYQDFMTYMAGNPEAAGRLLAGHHGQDDHFSNAGALFLYGPRFTDDGAAFGALIEAGAHDLRSTDLTLANAAAHEVIKASPDMVEHVGDEAKPALVTILDDHIADFEYVATDRAEADTMTAPVGSITGLTYEEGEAFLKELVADGATREDTAVVVGDRVAYSIDQVGVTGDIRHAQRAGALSEMSVLATAEANIDAGERADMMDKIASTTTGKLLSLTPPGRAPLVGDLMNVAVGEVFSGGHVEQALEENNEAQLDAFGGVKRLSILSQIAHGQLPDQMLNTINADGTMNMDFIGSVAGQDDVVRTSQDGASGEPLAWDINEDGEIDADEREITESELYNAGTGPAEVASDAMRSLHSIQYDGANPPDIDSLPLPDGYDNDNPSTFEEVWNWPFDAPGEGTISDGSDVVAEQGDLEWDPRERVYTLEVEGGEELHYQRFGEDWKLVEKVGDEWRPVD